MSEIDSKALLIVLFNCVPVGDGAATMVFILENETLKTTTVIAMRDLNQLSKSKRINHIEQIFIVKNRPAQDIIN